MLTEWQIIERIATGVEFPPLRTVQTTLEPNLSESDARKNRRPDLAINFAWQDKELKFLADVRRQSSPKALTEAIRQIRLLVKERVEISPRTKYFPLLIVPYLNPDAIDRLIAADVSGIDLSGNGVVIVPGEWFVYRTGSKNAYPSTVPIKNVFRGTSSLVARALLMRPCFSSVNEVYEEIKARGGAITLPTVSKALKALQEELLVGREKDIRLLDAKRLLEALEKNYRRPFTTRRLRGRFTDKQANLARMVANATETNIPLVAVDPTRYAVMPTGDQMIQFYTRSIDSVMHGVRLTETNRFPDIELCETEEPTVYFARRWEDDLYWTSPLEVYLLLATGGKREHETAEQMRDDIQQFRYYL